jgi:hypothetical protein
MPGGSGLITIIILIAVVWQIISMIIAHAQQQKQRQAEAEARRQQLLSGGGQRGGERATPAALAGGARGQSHPKMSKLDELAARRQQQLEELRRRRETGRKPAPAAPGTQPRAGSTTASEWESSAQLRTGQRTTSGVGLPIDIEPRRVPTTQPSRRLSPGQKQQALQEQQRVARQRQQQQQQQARLLRAEELARRQREEHELATSPYAAGEIGVAEARRSEREAYGIAVPAAPDEPVQLGRVQQLLRNRATLRELIVMKEVLDQPVSLREPRSV